MQVIEPEFIPYVEGRVNPGSARRQKGISTSLHKGVPLLFPGNGRRPVTE